MKINKGDIVFYVPYRHVVSGNCNDGYVKKCVVSSADNIDDDAYDEIVKLSLTTLDGKFVTCGIFCWNDNENPGTFLVNAVGWNTYELVFPNEKDAYKVLISEVSRLRDLYSIGKSEICKSKQDTLEHILEELHNLNK